MQQTTRLNPPRISVIISNYNYAAYLKDAIVSVLKQSYPPHEIIVVDDGSTDHSKDIIEFYKDKIKAIYLPQNQGQGAAFNAGFTVATGDIICFLDEDDYFLPQKLEAISQAWQQHPEATLFFHRAQTVDKKLKTTLKSFVFPHKLVQGDYREFILQHHESLLPPTSCLCFTRDFLDRIMPLPVFMTQRGADFPLQMISCLIGKPFFVDGVLTLYRVHGENGYSRDFNLTTLSTHAVRMEKAFYCINKMLARLNITDRLDAKKNRYHQRNLFIFKRLSYKEFFKLLMHPNFTSIKNRLEFLWFGLIRRWEYYLETKE